MLKFGQKRVITGLQETLVRRLNRQAAIDVRGDTIRATAPDARESRNGQMIYRNLVKRLYIINEGGRFRAIIYVDRINKKIYWRKWKPARTVLETEIVHSDFNKLIKQIQF